MIGNLEVVSKSEWKLAGELVELQMTFNALQQKYEAERQRAVEQLVLAGEEVFKLRAELAALKSEINWPVAQKVRAALDRAACPDAFMRIAVEACTAELKGDQVPVAYLYSASFERGEVEGHLTDAPGCDMPVYDRPQKPVEHPDTKRMDWLCAHTVQVRDPVFYGSHAMFWSQCDSDDCEEHHTKLREQVDAAIEAAGGLSIPQATLEAAPQKPVISKEKLCDWLEDNFDIDDSQRDAFAQCFAHHCNCIVKKED